MSEPVSRPDGAWVPLHVALIAVAGATIISFVGGVAFSLNTHNTETIAIARQELEVAQVQAKAETIAKEQDAIAQELAALRNTCGIGK